MPIEIAAKRVALNNCAEFFSVSEIDFEAVNSHKWYLHGTQVKRTHDKLPLLTFLAHRMCVEKAIRINGVGLDYTRENLRTNTLRPVTEGSEPDTFIVSECDLAEFAQHRWRKGKSTPYTIIDGRDVSAPQFLAKLMGLVQGKQFKRGNNFQRWNIKGNPSFPVIVDGACRIPVALDISTYVAIEDYEWVKQNLCTLKGNGYACTVGGLLHRQILKRRGVKLGVETDHIDGDKLNNRFCNLRPCSRSQNAYAQGKRITNTSGYVGVERYKNRWRARIERHNRSYELGTYTTVEKAAAARNFVAFLVSPEFLPDNGVPIDVLTLEERRYLASRIERYPLLAKRFHTAA